VRGKFVKGDKYIPITSPSYINYTQYIARIQ
jgi:hypothetical protein